MGFIGVGMTYFVSHSVALNETSSKMADGENTFLLLTNMQA